MLLMVSSGRISAFSFGGPRIIVDLGKGSTDADHIRQQILLILPLKSVYGCVDDIARDYIHERYLGPIQRV
jgi:hypothetical protein